MSYIINSNFFSFFLIITLFHQIITLQEWWENTKVPILNDTNFHEIIGHNKYVVVEFFTRTCIYCRHLAPEYEKFYESFLTKREDVSITKIECLNSKKTCMDYGVFAFPFIALYFPESKKMKSVFKYRRTSEELEKWVDIIAPKKNLKQIDKEEKKENLNENDNMTKIGDYIIQQFTDVKKDIIVIEKFLNDNLNNISDIIEKNDIEFYGDDDIDVIEIKITPFFIVKCVGIFFFIRIIIFFIKNYLFKYEPLPKNIHQKN